jgi:diguanylate cyclase (GGDEF)-like protein/PAS domain S-box-containing protein
MLDWWQRSILFRTGLILLAVFLSLGVATVGFTIHANQQRALASSTLRLTQLLDTVESTASVACFARDEILAAELASGLLSNSEVLAVTIHAGEQVLASRQRELPESEQPLAGKTMQRAIFSPFSEQLRVGEIRLVPNRKVIEESMREDLHRASVQMAAQLLLTALAVVAAMLLLIIRPIKAISDELHSMDPTRGERLALPHGHGASEIGTLVKDVNMLAIRLVRALDEERELRIQREMDEKRYHAIFENAETGIFILDGDGKLNSWNPAFARLLALAESQEQPAQLSLVGLAWREPARVSELILGCLNRNVSASADLSYCPAEGSEIWLNLVLTPIGGRSLQGVIHDVTQHKEAEASARLMAITDNLTGVANRLGLEYRLDELEQGYHLQEYSGFALMLVDFDDFHRINEGFGVPGGDEILKEATRRLSGCVKGTDVVARLGADRFALALPDLQRGLDAERVADRVLQSLQQRYLLAGSPLLLRVSIGIAMYPSDSDNGIPSLLRNVELALDQAKAHGGRGLHFYDPLLAAAAENRRRLENDLRQAIQERQFVLFYQPIIDLQSRQLAGAEALIRWQHPERGLVPPDAFIPLAEETELIDEIGQWALDMAARQLAEWQAAGQDWYLSVNVSARQIPDGLPPAVLRETVERHAVASHGLALEITEGVLLNDVGSALEWLQQVRSQGFSVYLDDFGTGYSSLSYLKRFPVDRLKVDKSFVGDITRDGGDLALVKAVLAMAESLNIGVVAEGVEEAEQVRLLHAMNCRFVQGYYFSRPVPIEEFAAVSQRLPALLQESLAG